MYIKISLKTPSGAQVKDFEVDSKQRVVDFIKKVNEEYHFFSDEQEENMSLINSSFLCRNVSVFGTFENHGIITGDILEIV